MNRTYGRCRDWRANGAIPDGANGAILRTWGAFFEAQGLRAVLRPYTILHDGSCVMSSDPFHLGRFVEAQDGVYPRVCEELRAGEKRSHWMWFIFPQIRGLGRSPMAERFAIGSLEEARAYLAHEILGVRLRECAALVNAVEGRAASEIFGFPDDLKFHSSMTLFAKAAEGETVFQEALEKYFGGEMDGGRGGGFEEIQRRDRPPIYREVE